MTKRSRDNADMSARIIDDSAIFEKLKSVTGIVQVRECAFPVVLSFDF